MLWLVRNVFVESFELPKGVLVEMKLLRGWKGEQPRQGNEAKCGASLRLFRSTARPDHSRDRRFRTDRLPRKSRKIMEKYHLGRQQ